jgi:hypothetical protein
LGTGIITVIGVSVTPLTAYAQTGTITACFHKSNGKTRLVQAASECKRNETVATWNIVGPQGDPGPEDPAGAVGPQGPLGADGTGGGAGRATLAVDCDADGTVQAAVLSRSRRHH